MKKGVPMNRAMNRNRGLVARIERLESRVFLSASLGKNLVVNPGAEAGPSSTTGDNVASIPGWGIGSFMGQIGTVVPYGAAGFISDSDPGPSNRGDNFFAGGKAAFAQNFQEIDLSNLGTDIDAGRISYSFSAFLGGLEDEADNAMAELFFVRGAVIGSRTLEPPVRAGATKLVEQTDSGTVLANTRGLFVRLTFDRKFGTNNDGYADN
ncbi:MAG: hypothetical protein ACREJC_16995, partial [Tepidisphaeraceae bacterium]